MQNFCNNSDVQLIFLIIDGKKVALNKQKSFTHHIAIWSPLHYIPLDCYVPIRIEWIVCICRLPREVS